MTDACNFTQTESPLKRFFVILEFDQGIVSPFYRINKGLKMSLAYHYLE